MKLVDFQCDECKYVFEDLIRKGEEPPTCPKCSYSTKQIITWCSHILNQDLQTTARSDTFLAKTERWRKPLGT